MVKIPTFAEIRHLLATVEILTGTGGVVTPDLLVVDTVTTTTTIAWQWISTRARSDSTLETACFGTLCPRLPGRPLAVYRTWYVLAGPGIICLSDARVAAMFWLRI